METDHVSDNHHDETVVETFSPKIPWNQHGSNEGENGCQDFVMPVLKHDDGVIFEVGKVETFPFGDNVGMFANHDPADVGEEEATRGVMWVTVRFRVKVMNSVVTSPFVGRVLVCGKNIYGSIKG